MTLHESARALRGRARFPAGISFPPFPNPRTVRDTGGLPESLGRMGALEVRLATRKKDIRKAQRLRFKVFYMDGGAKADPRSALTRRDICPFDRVCDHLMVIDHAALNRFGRGKPKVVGVYRLLRQNLLRADGGFYTAGEFWKWGVPACIPIGGRSACSNSYGAASGLTFGTIGSTF
jgi:putative hemolysin